MTDLSRAAQAAERAAYAAGTHLLASRSRLNEVLFTHDQPAAVAADIEREAEALVRDVVLRAFPDHDFMGRLDAEPADAAGPVWVVHALDGQENYLRSIAQYAVSIALVIDGEPQIGVVYEPCRNEFFGAIRGRGAVLNGVPIRCAAPPAPAQGRAATVFPALSSPRMPLYMGELGRVSSTFGRVRRSGSRSLELAYVAAGRVDAFWEHEVRPWAAAAGALLVRESGALIEARDRAPVLRSSSVLASTPAARDTIFGLLAAA